MKLVNFNFLDKELRFVENRNKFFIGSAFLIILGLLIMSIMGLNLGVDFTGGTKLEIQLEENFDMQELLQVFEENGYAEIGSQRIVGNDNNIAELIFPREITLTQEDISAITRMLSEHYGLAISMSEATISPQIAQELALKAIYAVLFASIGIIIYVTIRFEYRFALAAIIALFHDALVVIAAFSLFRMEVNLPFIAAMLLIVGYSINDTIVIFDRIRENLKFAKIKTGNELSALVNRSIKENLARTINTSVTVLFVAFCLLIFGGEPLRNFSFALVIGLIAGTYSSIFIASQVWFVWKKRDVEKKIFQTQAKENN